jgi:hypothetical protein
MTALVRNERGEARLREIDHKAGRSVDAGGNFAFPSGGAIKTLGDVVHDQPVYLVFHGRDVYASMDDFAKHTKRLDKVMLVASPDTDREVRMRATVRVTLTAEGKLVPVVATKAESRDMFAWMQDGRLYLPDFYAGREMLPALMTMATSPTLPYAIRTLVSPQGAPTQLTFKSLRETFGDFNSAQLTIAAGTRLYHTAAHISRSGFGSHTGLDGGNLQVYSQPEVATQAENLANHYPMRGVVVLSTARSTRANERDGVVYGAYFVTRDITTSEILPPPSVAASSSTSAAPPSRIVLHAIAPRGNAANDEWASHFYVAATAMHSDPDIDSLCIAVWNSPPPAGKPFGTVDHTCDVDLIFVQTVSTIPTAAALSGGFSAACINMFTCDPGAVNPNIEFLSTQQPKYIIPLVQ